MALRWQRQEDQVLDQLGLHSEILFQKAKRKKKKKGENSSPVFECFLHLPVPLSRAQHVLEPALTHLAVPSFPAPRLATAVPVFALP